jgi:hypothetical protein
MDFRKLLTVVLAASLIMVLKGLNNLLILWLRGGPEMLRHPGDLVPAIGLDLAFKGQSVFAQSLLTSLNLFDAWYLSLLTLGIVKVTRCPLANALLMSSTVWFLGVLIEMQLLGVSRRLDQLFA